MTVQELQIFPEIGIPYVPTEAFMDLKERADAACNTTMTLEQLGAIFEPTDIDMEIAATLCDVYLNGDSTHVSKTVTNTRAATLTPASLVLVNSVLTEFGQQVVKHSLEIRNIVTNKLLIESEHPDARIRLRAIELLGKLSDVGAFTDKSEVVHTHQTSGDLRSKLKQKLNKMIDITDVVEVVSDQ
jgi:hypothetical protein